LSIPAPTVPIHMKYFLSSAIALISLWLSKTGDAASEEKRWNFIEAGSTRNNPLELPAQMRPRLSSTTTSYRIEASAKGGSRESVLVSPVPGSKRIKPILLVAIQ